MRWLTGKNASEALLVEAVAAGLAFAALLCFGGACLVGSFRPYALPMPYWAALPLRTDTAGALAFFVAAVCITVSEYLRLQRRRAAASSFADSGQAERPRAADRETARPMTQAVSKAVLILCTGLVTYISFNAVTHPVTLQMQVTHFLPFPTEGSLRVGALVLVFASVAVRRFLQGEQSVPRSEESVPRSEESGLQGEENGAAAGMGSPH